MVIRAFTKADLPQLIDIWNEVVEEGSAFPQLEFLDAAAGEALFSEQSYVGVAEDGGTVVGLYILHPNNVGRCGHICNASYAVRAACRGKHVGRALVTDCLARAKELGFSILQFNAVVESNAPARRLYEDLGFVRIGTVPGGFRMKDGHFENIWLYYHLL